VAKVSILIPIKIFFSYSNSVFSVALIILAIVFSTVCAQAKENKLLSAVTSPQFDFSMESKVDGKEFIDDMKSTLDSYNTYSFQYEMTVFKGKKVTEEKGNFYFKKPNLMRAEEIGNYKKGAIAVVDKNGKIKGHLGGALSAFTVTLQKDSDMLRSANGYSLLDSDFSSMAQVMQNFVKKGMQSKLSNRPINIEGISSKVYVLELYKGSQNPELFKRAYVDPKTLTPVEWFDYINGQLFAHTIWKNLQININLKDDIFTI
jgi:outer membrane lipoprotein-sorting protein